MQTEHQICVIAEDFGKQKTDFLLIIVCLMLLCRWFGWFMTGLWVMWLVYRWFVGSLGDLWVIWIVCGWFSWFVGDLANLWLGCDWFDWFVDSFCVVLVIFGWFCWFVGFADFLIFYLVWLVSQWFRVLQLTLDSHDSINFIK